MNIKQIIVAATLAVASIGASAQEWNTSVGVTIHGRNGSVSVGANNYPNVVVYPQAPVVVYPQPQQVIIVPCYNCGQYPQGHHADPYRNHHHLQRHGHHGHHPHSSVNISIHN